MGVVLPGKFYEIFDLVELGGSGLSPWEVPRVHPALMGGVFVTGLMTALRALRGRAPISGVSSVWSSAPAWIIRVGWPVGAAEQCGFKDTSEKVNEANNQRDKQYRTDKNGQVIHYSLLGLVKSIVLRSYKDSV